VADNVTDWDSALDRSGQYAAAHLPLLPTPSFSTLKFRPQGKVLPPSCAPLHLQLTSDGNTLLYGTKRISRYYYYY